MKPDQTPDTLFCRFQSTHTIYVFVVLYGMTILLQIGLETLMSNIAGENPSRAYPLILSPYNLLAKALFFALLLFLFYRVLLSYSKGLAKKELLEITVENSPEAIYWVDGSGSFFYMNESAEKIFGYRLEEGRQMSVFDLYRHDRRYDEQSWKKQWENTKKNKRLLFESRHSTKEGPVLDVEVLAFYTRVFGFEYLVGHVRDISAKKQLQYKMSDINRGLKRKNEELERLHHVMNKYVPISKTDTHGIITYVNDALCELTGYAHEELLGKSHSILRHPDTPDIVYDRLWRSIDAGSVWSDELQNRRKNGTSYWVKIHIHPDYNSDGRKVGYTAIRENITDKINLERLASTDSLTKIYNRTKFNEVLNRRLAETKRYDEIFSLIMCDLDHFKEVNDIYGHKYGDKVLQEFVGIAQKGLRESDFFARWGGEEFVILLPHTSLKEAHRTAQKIKEMLENTAFESIAKITASFGVTQVKRGDTEATLIERADKAMYRSKSEGRNRISDC